MVNKITNWTFGGFFRTIGRTLAFLVIGLLVGLFLEKNDIKIGHLLGFEVVEAKGLAGWGYYEVNYDVALNYHVYNCSGNDNCSTDVSLTQNGLNHCANSYSCTIVPYMETSSINTSSTNGTILTTAGDIIYAPNYIYGVSMYFCTNKAIGTIDNVTPLVVVGAAGNTTPVTNNVIDYVTPMSGGTISTDVMDDGMNYWNYCYNFRYAFSVKERASWVGFRIKPDNNVNSIKYSIFGLSHYNYGVDSELLRNLATNTDIVEMTDNIVAAQTDTTNAVDSLHDTIKDDDTDDDSNDMADFITDFEFGSQSGVTGIVNSLLSLVENSLISSSNADWCVVFRGQNVCLPSGDIIWGRNDVGQFREYFTLIVGGYLFFKMLRSFIMTLDKAIDPKTDKLDVMKL